MHKCKRCNLYRIPENSILAICPDCKARQDKADKEQKNKEKDIDVEYLKDFLFWRKR